MSAPELRWTADLTAAQRTAVHALLRAATATDGVEPVGEQVVLALDRTAPAGTTPHLLAEVDGALTGYAHLEPATADEPAFVELAVHPEHRRAGTGSALLAAALTGTARVWAHGDTAPARALAAAAGLTSVRELWQMRLDLATTTLPELGARADVTLRTYAGPADDDAVLAVNNAAFSWHPEQCGWTAQDLADRRAEPWFDAAGFFLATDAGTGELLGFHWTKVHAPEGGEPEHVTEGGEPEHAPEGGQPEHVTEGGEPAIGEVYVVGIAPAAQGRGLGRLLTLAGLHHLREQGLPAVLLYVEGDNTAAVHTYERLGFTRFHTDRAWARA